MAAERDLEEIEETAAAWLIERDRGLTPRRERELCAWLAADARHAAAFRALVETWTLLGEAEPVRATADAGERGRAGRAGSWLAWTSLTLAAAAAIVVVFLRGTPRVAEAREALGHVVTAATEVGAWRKMDLPDGSAIQLNTDTAVEVRFGATERRVRLVRGEAHFAVAKDAARPFVVNAGGVDVRVVGTVFNVRLRNEAVDVLVTEGKVRVQQPAAEVSELSAGERVSVERGAVTRPVTSAAKPVAATPAEVRQALAWQTRRLDFDATPLGEIVAEINRYNRHKLVIADAELEARRFGGSFPANDYETLVRMLEADFGVTAERKGGETLLRVRRR